MNKISQVNAASERRPLGGTGNRARRAFASLGIATVAIAAPLAAGLTGASPASASTQPVLALSNGSNAWVASGSSYTGGLSNVQLWVQDVTNGGWTTLEYQSGLSTSTYTVVCAGHICRVGPAGLLRAQGQLYYVPGVPGGFPGYWAAQHPLLCGHSYEAVSYDPSDGWVYSNVLAEPACVVTR
jgi:hypothetical protein